VTISLKEKSIGYVNRDFSALKRRLMGFTQAHHSGVLQDYNESSPAMYILDVVAAIGDVLGHYQDVQFEEMRQDASTELKNADAFARALGYEPAGKRASVGVLSAFVEVPCSSDGLPDPVYVPTLRMGSQVQGPNGVVFETTENVHFSASSPTDGTTRTRRIVVTRRSQDGSPTFVAISKDVPVVSGETRTTTFDVGGYAPFLELTLPDQDVLEVLSVTDSDGNDWRQVSHLAHEMVFDGVPNVGEDSDTVPFSLRLTSVPRRFKLFRDVETNLSSLVFGTGDGSTLEDELVPSVADYSIPLNGRSNFDTFSIDPQNFLKTRTLGLAPQDVTLTVRYRVGGGPETIVAPGTLTSFKSADMEFPTTSLDAATRDDVIGSIDCINEASTQGGGPVESVLDIKSNRAAFFAAQDRCVTSADYVARLYSIPPKFGRVVKVFVRPDESRELNVNIHILSDDVNGNFAQASPALVTNVQRYIGHYRMLTDKLNILQTDIINVAVQFGIVVDKTFNRTEVLGKCLGALREEFANTRMEIAKPIVLSHVSSRLQSVVGVVSVYDLRITNRFGTVDGLSYSDVRFDVSAFTKGGIVYCPADSIFEVKHPTVDIVGR